MQPAVAAAGALSLNSTLHKHSCSMIVSGRTCMFSVYVICIRISRLQKCATYIRRYVLPVAAIAATNDQRAFCAWTHRGEKRAACCRSELVTVVKAAS